MSWAPGALEAARARADQSHAVATRRQYWSKATAWVLFCKKTRMHFEVPPTVDRLYLFVGWREQVAVAPLRQF